MTERNNEFDVAQTVKTTDPDHVNAEVDRIFLELYPDSKTDSLFDMKRIALVLSSCLLAACTPMGNLQPSEEVRYLTAEDLAAMAKEPTRVQAGDTLRIVRDALSEPARLIARNAGVEGSVIVERIRGEKGNVGYDAGKDEWVDMVKVGIIDPAKVTRSALQNAASIAAIVLTAEVGVVEKPAEEEPAAAGGHGHAH